MRTKTKPTPLEEWKAKLAGHVRAKIDARVRDGRRCEVISFTRGAQVERYHVERWKQISHRPKRWAWVPIGNFPATSTDEARKLARGATEQPLAFLRATRIGERPQVIRS